MDNLDPPQPPSNVPEFSVSELSFALKREIESAFPRVRVRGEISQPSFPRSGHCYFRLKDENAVIDGVAWKGTLPRLGIKIEEGLEVIATGKLTTYAGSSRYQIIVDRLELAGEGALLKLLEDRRKKLAAEGLFDQDRKRELPYLPEVIGVVTSPSGAVIRDILHRLSDRFPRRVLLWPVAVQGEKAAGATSPGVDVRMDSYKVSWEWNARKGHYERTQNGWSDLNWDRTRATTDNVVVLEMVYKPGISNSPDAVGRIVHLPRVPPRMWTLHS